MGVTFSEAEVAAGAIKSPGVWESVLRLATVGRADISRADEALRDNAS